MIRPSDAAGSSTAHSDDKRDQSANKRTSKTGAGSRGSYSSRVCTRCRKKKHKCLLDAAAIDLPSSTQPIPESLRCERCRKDEADCILCEDDVILKRRRLPSSSSNGPTTGQAEPLPSVMSLQSFVYTGQGGAFHNSAYHSASTSGVSANPNLACSSTAGIAATSQATASLSSSTAPQQLSLFQPDAAFTDKERRMGFSRAVLYGTRSIEMLSQLLIRTPGWCTAVGFEETLGHPASPCQLVDEVLSLQLEPWVNAHVLWHPELPLLPVLRSRYLTSPNTSTSLLLATLYLIALPKLTPQPPDAADTLSRLALCVRREAFTVIMGAPGNADAILALMLLSQYAPTAMLSPVPPGEFRDTSAIVGRGLLVTATHIAQLVHLQESPAMLQRAIALRQQASQNPATDEASNRALAETLDCATLWFNLKRWQATLALEEAELSVPADLADIGGVELLLFDADAHLGLQPCPLQTMRTAGRMMLHSRLRMARAALMHAETFVFSRDLNFVQEAAERVRTATATVAKFYEEVKEEIARVRLVLGPLVQSSPSVGVLLQWMQLEPQAWHSTVLRVSWIYVIWGCPASVWHDSHTGPSDIGARMSASEPIQNYSRSHAHVRSQQIEQLLLSFTDLACTAANAQRNSTPGTIGSVNAAVAAVPTLTLCAMVVSHAKAELDEKSATMSTVRQLSHNTARHISLIRFAAHCLREMDAAYKRGEIDVESGIRSGSLYMVSAALCSSIASTIAEWKSHVDARALTVPQMGGPVASDLDFDYSSAHSGADHASSSRVQAQGHAPPPPFHLYSKPDQQQAENYGASQQLEDQAFVQSLTGEPGQWDYLLTSWLDTEASQAQAAPFDWASVFGLPHMFQGS